MRQFLSLLPPVLAFVGLVTASCSSETTQGDDTFGSGGQEGGGQGGAQGGNAGGGEGDTGFIQAPPNGNSGGVSPSASGAPNFGTETVCDDMDNDGNGVIDDVDVGKDGLCDCIHIGFFGEVASDAGDATGSFEAWLVARSGQIPIQHLDATEKLTPAWLASLQVLIVGGLRDRAAQAGAGEAFAADEIAAFDDWIQTRGGGAISLSGYTSNIDDARPVSELLQHTGLSYDLVSVSGAGVISEGAPPVWLQDITTPDHPIVDGVSEIGVYYGYPVEGDGTAILSGEGHVLGMAKQWGTGRVFAFADEWITQDATWQGLANGQQNHVSSRATNKRVFAERPRNSANNAKPKPVAIRTTRISRLVKRAASRVANPKPHAATPTPSCAKRAPPTLRHARKQPRACG